MSQPEGDYYKQASPAIFQQQPQPHIQPVGVYPPAPPPPQNHHQSAAAPSGTAAPSAQPAPPHPSPQPTDPRGRPPSYSAVMGRRTRPDTDTY